MKDNNKMYWLALIILGTLCTLISAQIEISSSTTTSIATSTTTTPPSTTTAAITSTEEPAVTVPPRKPDYVIKGAGGNCILFAGNVTFSITYTTKDSSSATGELQIPRGATVTGNCTDFTNRLAFAWPVNNTGNSSNAGGNTPSKGGQPAAANLITFLFIKRPDFSGGNDTGMGSYSLTAVFGTVVADFPDANPGQVFRFNGKPNLAISAKIGAPYKCMSEQNVIWDSTGNTHMTLADVKLEAFRINETSQEFTDGEESLCAADNSILPLIGYALLGLLVITVLAAAAGFAYYKLRRAGYASV